MAVNTAMNESFLHYLWLHQHFYSERLFTTGGEIVEVLHPGTYNLHAGPDFFSARLRIGATSWAGNVEIHVRSSDWNRHRHREDPLYTNCILHVVWEHDTEVCGVDGIVLPTLEVKDKFDEKLSSNYQVLLQGEHILACRQFLPAVHPVVRSLVLDRMMVERLEHRSTLMIRLLESTTWHWEEAFFHALARNFGFHVNADAFERLARAVPYASLLRLRDRLLSLEAILFGQAGFLSADMEDDYAAQLRAEYLFQQRRLRLKPLANPGWKFLRMRPANFPTVRIAQLAMVLHASFPVFQQCTMAERLEDVVSIFRVGVSPYWRSHLRPDVTTVMNDHVIGEASIHLLIINTVIPFLFLRGRKTGDDSLCEKAIQWLGVLPPEDNAVLRSWTKAGWIPRTASESQALLQLHDNYCAPKKCINCTIGNQFILSPHDSNSFI